MNNFEQKGQVALVLVLVMTVASALAVSLAARSTVNTRVQKTDTLSVQSQISAQTGVEQILSTGNDSASGDTYSAVKNDVDSSFLNIGLMEPGTSVEINLTGVDFTNFTYFSVYWAPDKSNPSGQPAMFISVVHPDGTIDDYAYDYNGNNGFIAAFDGSNISGFVKRTTALYFNTTASKIVITTLGAPALVRVNARAGNTFPSQATTIKSVGSVVSGAETVKYGLQYEESKYNTIPSVFNYVLFSGGSIIQ